VAWKNASPQFKIEAMQLQEDADDVELVNDRSSRRAARDRTGDLIDAIAARRRACGDESEALTDDPLGAVSYVMAHRDVPRPVLRADAADAVELVRLTRRRLDEIEYGVILLARRQGVTWAEIARRLRLSSYQAAAQRFEALTAWLDPEIGKKDVPQLRAQRRRKSWASANRVAIRDLAADLLATDLPYACADSAEELESVLRDSESSATTLVIWLEMVYKELEAAGELCRLPNAVCLRLQRVVEDWDAAGQPCGRRSARRTAHPAVGVGYPAAASGRRGA
jgi:hypothetical protein